MSDSGFWCMHSLPVWPYRWTGGNSDHLFLLFETVRHLLQPGLFLPWRHSVMSFLVPWWVVLLPIRYFQHSRSEYVVPEFEQGYLSLWNGGTHDSWKLSVQPWPICWIPHVKIYLWYFLRQDVLFHHAGCLSNSYSENISGSAPRRMKYICDG